MKNNPGLEHRLYKLDESCVFKKNTDEFGGFSNMSSVFPLQINGIKIRSSEALYQLCRFVYEPSIQAMIINERSPMIVKNISKKYANLSRPDWNQVRVKIMKWCVQVKIAQHFVQFGLLFDKSTGRNIVENSAKDSYWGAIPNKEFTEFKGVNALGRILMGLREQYMSEDKLKLLRVEPPSVIDFLIMNEPVCSIDERLSFINYLVRCLNLSVSDVLNSVAGLNNLNNVHGGSGFLFGDMHNPHDLL